MTPQTIGFSEVKARFSEITQEVNRTGQPVLVYKHNRPWVNITPAAQESKPKRTHAAFGILSEYANPDLIDHEDGAWEKAVVETLTSSTAY